MPKTTKRSEEIQRKRELLAESLNQQPAVDHENYFTILLREYAEGKEVSRYSLVECIVGKYREVLRVDHGPCLDGPLSADIEGLLNAAEQRFKAKT